MKQYQEGDKCPHFGSDCCGRLILPPVENCSCHINPPCAQCTNNRLRCDDCGEDVE